MARRFLLLGGPKHGEWMTHSADYSGRDRPQSFVVLNDSWWRNRAVVTYHPHRVKPMGWRVWIWIYFVEGLDPRDVADRPDRFAGTVLPGGIIGRTEDEIYAELCPAQWWTNAPIGEEGGE